MRRKNILHGLIITISLTALAFSGWQPAFAQFETSGWFTIIWGDGPSGSTATAPVYMLTDDSGQTASLLMDESLAAPLGGVLALDRRRITVSGLRGFSATDQGSQPTIQVDSIALENSQGEAGAEGVNTQVSGSQPFLSIMCKFSDIAAEPKSLTYFQNMYSNVHPGLDDYWREVSYITANIAGSAAVGWYTLPQPRSYYVYDQNSDGHPDLNFSRAASDCTHQADLAGMNFAPFKGINLMFNEIFDSTNNFAWGGSSHCVAVDGGSKCFPMTWEPPWGYSNIAVISHEMGHAFGLPHSSGTYGQTYDNQWDVMSDTWSNCSNDPTYGCLGQHTISYHKDKLGWIPAGKKYTASGNATITLEQLAVPQTSNYRMAQIPIGGSSTHFYTVEVRRKTGYDIKLPGQAVIIHEVDTTRLRPANVIDADGTGNTGDEGGKWTPGEIFSDAAHGISVKVLSATTTGFRVEIHAPAAPKSAVFKSVGANDGWILESAENSNKGGALNSAATTFNLGTKAKKQYLGILSFSTATLPDNAVITAITLKIKKQGITGGGDPLMTFQGFMVDIKKGSFGTATLQTSDFQAKAGKSYGPFYPYPVSNWYTIDLTSANGYINKLSSNGGLTQVRLRFKLDDNNNAVANYVSLFSGNAPAGNRPQLVITYIVP